MNDTITRRFEMRSFGHFKFWEVTYPEWTADPPARWSTRWGRIGTDGQLKHFTAANWMAAQDAAAAKMQEKIGKGYLEVDQFSDPVQPSSQQTRRPIQKVKLAPQPIEHTQPASAQPAITPKKKSVCLVLLDAGHDRDEIAETLGLTRGQVNAIAAHATMGTYGERSKTIAEQSGRRAKRVSRSNKINRAFILDD